MFDISIALMVQLVELIPAFVSIWLIFDLIGGLLFKND